MARACEIVFVDAATVRNIADMVNLTKTVKRKKAKNWEGSERRPARKYRIRLKQVAMMSLTGASDMMPARASAKGWQKLLKISASNDNMARGRQLRKLSRGNLVSWVGSLTHKKHVFQQ
jgi:hypothetical protein